MARSSATLLQATTRFSCIFLSNDFSHYTFTTKSWLCSSDFPLTLTTLHSLSFYAPRPTNHRRPLFHNPSDEEKAAPRSAVQSRISKLRLHRYLTGTATGRRVTITRFLWVCPVKRKGEVRGSWRSTIGPKNGTRCTSPRTCLMMRLWLSPFSTNKSCCIGTAMATFAVTRTAAPTG